MAIVSEMDVLKASKRILVVGKGGGGRDGGRVFTAIPVLAIGAIQSNSTQGKKIAGTITWCSGGVARDVHFDDEDFVAIVKEFDEKCAAMVADIVLRGSPQSAAQDMLASVKDEFLRSLAGGELAKRVDDLVSKAIDNLTGDEERAVEKTAKGKKT